MYNVHNYVARKYGEAIIIFDGYGETSTKDTMHLRRNKGQAGVNVTFAEEIQLSMKKATFLANGRNQQRLINLLGNCLDKKKCNVYHAPRNADLLIVQKAVESSTVMDTVMVGNDTNLIVSLCYHASLNSHSILFQQEPKKNAKNPVMWDIKVVKKQLGPEICACILFLYAIIECDTASHLYSIGKGTSLKKFILSSHFQDKAKVFNADEQLDSMLQRFCEKWLQMFHTFIHKLYYPLQLLQNITAFVSTFRYRNGKVMSLIN